MATVLNSLSDLEAKVEAGEAFSRADAERVLACSDLVSVGMLGDAARRRVSGDEITFGRVCSLSTSEFPPERGEAGEVRLLSRPASIAEARDEVRLAATFAAGAPLTAFSAADLLAWCDHDLGRLTECAAILHADGLEGVAEFPVDRCGTTDQAVDVVRAILGGGLAVWRATVDRAPLDERLTLIERAADVQKALGRIRAFAPLPRLDPVDAPSTGYDDVRTIAVTRLLCRGIVEVQVDWPLYGPKLAQVALAYGASDVDGVASMDVLHLGARRSPKEDILRQIRAAGGVPVERNGRYERLS